MKYFLFFLLNCNLFYTQNTVSNNLNQYDYAQLEDIFYYDKENNKIRESQIVAKYYLQKAKKEKKENYIAEGYVLMQYNNTLPMSLKYIDSLDIISKNLNDDRYPARIYLLKGMLYYNFDDQKLSLENFIKALKYAKEKNNKRQIVIADLQIAYLNNYIGKHKEAVRVLLYYYSHSDFLSNDDVEYIRVNLASTYLDINKNDEAFKLITKGIESTKENHQEVIHERYLSLLGEYYLKIKNYSNAISILENSKKYFLKNNFAFDANYTMLYLGQAYANSQNKDKAIDNFIKIDSITKKTNNTFPELREVYTFIIDYYKEKNNKEKQLYYIERFLKVDKILDTQFRYVSRELPKKYDTPKLLEEKESIINDLKDRKTTLYFSIGILLFILLSLTYLYYKSKKREKLHRKIAQDLIQSIEKKNLKAPDIKPNLSSDQKHELIEKEVPFHELENQFINDDKNKIEQFSKEIENKAVKTIPEDVLQYVLRELTLFENKELFLKKGITLANLAKNMKTNTAYLSEIINRYKGKNFAAYLNDLRIDYALNKLVEDKRFRSYKLSVIAEELGYNNEQAFSLAFKKKTGTTLSIYIKEIEHTHQPHKNT